MERCMRVLPIEYVCPIGTHILSPIHAQGSSTCQKAAAPLVHPSRLLPELSNIGFSYALVGISAFASVQLR